MAVECTGGPFELPDLCGSHFRVVARAILRLEVCVDADEAIAAPAQFDTLKTFRCQTVSFPETDGWSRCRERFENRVAHGPTTVAANERQEPSGPSGKPGAWCVDWLVPGGEPFDQEIALCREPDLLQHDEVWRCGCLSQEMAGDPMEALRWPGSEWRPVQVPGNDTQIHCRFIPRADGAVNSAVVCTGALRDYPWREERGFPRRSVFNR